MEVISKVTVRNSWDIFICRFRSQISNSEFYHIYVFRFQFFAFMEVISKETVRNSWDIFICRFRSQISNSEFYHIYVFRFKFFAFMFDLSLFRLCLI